MKKTKWLFGIFFALFALISCNEETGVFVGGVDPSTLDVVTPITATVYLPTLQTLDVCSNVPYNLTAGQTINAGTLEVVNDGEYLYVTFNTSGTFGTLHLWIGTDLLNIPMNPINTNPQGKVTGGNPIPGHFPYIADGNLNTKSGTTCPPSAGLQHYTFQIPLIDYNFACGANLYFVAHAEVSGDMDGDGVDEGSQTAFGGNTGVYISEPGRWYFYGSYTIQCCTFDVPNNPTIKSVQTAYAKPTLKIGTGYTGWVFVGKSSKTNKSNPEDYYPLILTQNRWGWVANLKVFNTYIFDIWAGAGLNNTATNGTKVGTAKIEYTSTGITVTYNLTGAVLEEVHIYAGDLKLTTIAPGQYGYTKYFVTPFVEKTFTESFTVVDSNSDGVWVCLHAMVGIL